MFEQILPTRPGRAALAVLLLLAAGFVFSQWLASHDEQLRLKSALAAQQQFIAAADQREQQRASQLHEQLAQIEALKKRAVSPQQILEALPQYLPLPKPIQLAPPPNSSGQGTALPEKPPPAASPSVELPAEDLRPLFDFVQDCRACQAKLTAAQTDLADEREKSAAISRERDAAVKAARGGGFWARTRRAAKWMAIGVGVGAVLARLAH